MHDFVNEYVHELSARFMSKGSHEVTESVSARLCEWCGLNCYIRSKNYPVQTGIILHHLYIAVPFGAHQLRYSLSLVLSDLEKEHSTAHQMFSCFFDDTAVKI